MVQCAGTDSVFPPFDLGIPVAFVAFYVYDKKEEEIDSMVSNAVSFVRKCKSDVTGKILCPRKRDWPTMKSGDWSEKILPIPYVSSWNRSLSEDKVGVFSLSHHASLSIILDIFLSVFFFFNYVFLRYMAWRSFDPKGVVIPAGCHVYSFLPQSDCLVQRLEFLLVRPLAVLVMRND